MREWLGWIAAHQTAFWWLALASLAMFVASLSCVPVLVTRIPADYFAGGRRPRPEWAGRHFVIRGLVLVVKNAAGALLILMGIAMLVLPGQGILSIVVGVMLLNFPGKYRFERWLVSRPPVLRSINWLRRRADRGPLVIDDE